MAANSQHEDRLKRDHDQRGCHGDIVKYEDDNDGNAKGYFCSLCKEEWLADKENMNGETVVRYQHEAHHIVPYFCCMQNSDTGNYIQWKNINKTTGGLKPGDQVAWLRPGYWHHAIVENVPDDDSIKVIEWSFDVQSCGSIHSKTKTQKCGNCCRPMYKVYYPEEVEQLNPPEVVLMRARARLGDTGFCPCYDNCEHFATYCKTGLHHCNQLHQWKMTLRAWIYGIVVSLFHVTVFVAFSEFIEWFAGNKKHCLGAILLVVFEILYYIVVVCGIYCCDSPSEGFRTKGDKKMSRACRCASLKAFLQSVLFVIFAIIANIALLEFLNEKCGPWSEEITTLVEIGLGIAGGIVGNILGFFLFACIPYPCCRNEIPVPEEAGVI